jgi:hypothetical protein
MGYNARNDEIRDNVTRMRRKWESQRGALGAVHPRSGSLDPRCAPRRSMCANGYGPLRIIALSQYSSI